MKSIVLMTLVGTGLFSGTMAGLLAVQGRLNFEGTRGIPVVEMLFTEPEGEEHGEEGEGGALVSPHATVDDLDAAHGGGHEEQPPERLDGLGREARLPREAGPEVARNAAAGGAPAGRAEHPEQSHDDPHAGENQGGGHDNDHGGDSHASGGHGSEASLPHKAESLMGQDQYRRGQLFSFPRLESGLSIEELDQMVSSASELKKNLERRQSALEQREADLAAREADLQDRERAVLAKMREVLQERTKLEEEIASFQESYTMVRSSEVEQYRTYADTIAGLDTEQGSQIITQLWESEEGRTKAVKILKMMSADARGEIFAVLTPGQTQEILDRLTGAVIEGGTN